MRAEDTDALRAYVATWVSDYERYHGVDPLDHLTKPPYIAVPTEPNAVEVVFDSSSRDTHWKDMLVGFMAGLPASLGADFLGFNDRVAGRLHPGSVP